MSAETQIVQLGLTLPSPPKAVATYKTGVIAGNLLFLSGHGPIQADGTLMKGRVGLDLSEAQGREAARLTGLALLATTRDILGSLDRVKRVIKLLGMVGCPPEFLNHPVVINGCSDLFRDIFGDAGVGARSAVGMVSLPGNMAVEIEAIFEVE